MYRLDEIKVIQTIFLVIKWVLKFARLKGHPVFVWDDIPCKKYWVYMLIK